MTQSTSVRPVQRLGKNGPAINPIGYGCMGLSGPLGMRKSEAERYAILDHAYKSGARFWDTADAYGDNENLIGNWFERNPDARSQVFLATKFGNVRDPNTGKHSVCNTPEYIRQQCYQSLERLRTSHIDLYYMHRADKDQPVEITVKAMKELQDAGKVKHLGLSEVSADTLRRACKIAHIDAVQMEYSPFSLEIEKLGLLSACKELGVAIVAYAPLGKGLLTGTIRSPSDLDQGDMRRLFPRFSEENFHKNIELVDRLKAIADRKACTTSQLVLAWLMANEVAVFPIPGTLRIENLDNNMKALEVTISKQEDDEIRRAVNSAEVAGGRYPEAFASTLFADTAPLDQWNDARKMEETNGS